MQQRRRSLFLVVDHQPLGLSHCKGGGFLTYRTSCDGGHQRRARVGGSLPRCLCCHHLHVGQRWCLDLCRRACLNGAPTCILALLRFPAANTTPSASQARQGECSRAQVGGEYLHASTSLAFRPAAGGRRRGIQLTSGILTGGVGIGVVGTHRARASAVGGGAL